MRAFDWGCAATFLAIAAASCGGRVLIPLCEPEWSYCPESEVCCPTGMVCGTGSNGCPERGCCPASAGSDSGPPAGDAGFVDDIWHVDPPPPGTGSGTNPPTPKTQQ